ncbi:hypothetical protein [uncultured Algibacter sp.]|uniref:hypothetical protein n=1 Tax=uncultured Algibacter sp. TaxID=298659 RepID=UPI00262FC233|nr:hypothetical protein [uncultured Algibacter sp.]
MKLIKQLFNFYINSSIHVALAVFSLTWITLLELGLEYNEPVLYFVFYASITGYNFVKYFGIAKFHHRQLANWLKCIQLLSVICFLLMCYYGLLLKAETLVCIGVFAVLTLLYAIPLLSKQSLRHIGGLKIYIIGLVWVGVTVFIPVINESYGISTDVMIIGLQRFIFVLVLMLPFEIRDLKYDSLTLATIPQKMGVNRTRYLGLLLLMLFVLLEFFKDELTVQRILILVFMSAITGLFLYFSKINQRKYYSSFWVEGLPILWLVLLLLMP